MARKMKRPRTERGPSDDEDMPVEETTPPRRSSEAQRCSTKKNKNKGKVIKILVKLKNETSEMRKLFVNLIQSNNNQSKMLEKLIESHTYQSKNLETLTESHNDLRKQWEFHTNSPRSQWNREQPPRYRLVFKSSVTEKIEKGQTIEIHVALVDVNGHTVKNGPLASATVELVVIDAKFNQNDNQYNWSTEDFMSSIKKARQGNSALVNVDQSGTSIVSNGRFNLENGDKRHCDFTIFSNSSNKKVRLGVMVVSPTPERVLEGLSNSFFVRGHDRPNRTQARVDNGNPEQNGPMSNMQTSSCPNSTIADGNGWGINHMLGGQHQSLSQRNTPVLSTEPDTRQRHQVPDSSTVNEAWNNRIGVCDGCPEQNGPMPNMHNRVWQNSTQGLDTIGQTQLHFTRNTDMPSTEPSASQVQQDWMPQSQDHWQNLTHQPMNNGTGMPFYTNNQRVLPVHLVWDTPNVMPSKHCFHVLDQLMPLHSWQPKFYNSALPTAHLLQEYFGSLKTMPKEVMQTRRESGVLIEPLEPDDSDEGRPLKRKLHIKYQLRFVNKTCETYYTWDQIKADEGNLLKVALFDENNTKITSGPMSSASVEVVALHGDFNCDGQDYWTSEEFNRSVVCPPSGEEASSVLGGDRFLVLSGGEACLGDGFFRTTSFCARTGKFKMGVALASAQEERIQEGISEPFRVMDHRLAGECGRVFGKRLEEDSASASVAAKIILHRLLSMVKKEASSYLLLDQYKVMEGMEKQRKNLERMLLEIMDIIEDAEEKGVFHDLVAPSLNELKEVAYAADDIFDEFEYEAPQREAKKDHHSMLGMEVLRDRNPIVFRYRMSKKLRKIVKTIEVLVTEMKALGFRHMQQAPQSKQLMKTEPILFDSDMDIIRRSRDKEMNKIKGVLLHEASNMDLTILPIVGMGGMGKTTLACLIYNDPAIQKHFELRRWCFVSQDFDATNIANKICQTNVNDQDHEKALKDLQSIISGKQYLIVLDDIWNMNEAKWGKLMTCLKHGGKGSVVLATTRHAEMARIMKMGAAEAYNIEKLSPKHLKEIVLSRAFSLQKPNSDELDGIVDTIVERCAGCPLAAKTLGSLLSTKTSLEEWKAISDNDIWNNENSGILTSLYLSYVELPSHMKQCFSYCALFPKGYLIDVESLVHQWIALGFIPMQEDDNPETVGEEIFKELTWRSFFEEVKHTNPIEYGKRLQVRNGTMYKIHDLLYDLAQYVAGEQCFTTVDNLGTKKLLPNTIRHLFMSRDGISQRMASEFRESSIVGKKIEIDTKEVGQLLITNDNHHDIKVVSIVGIGGIGKTTLAHKIFNEATIQQHFKLKIWLSITQHFNEVDLLQTAIEHAGGVHGGVQDKTLLIRTLTNTLSTGKFLLVLDDVWSDEAWNHVLSVPIKNASKKQQGNWILMTTRLGDMAQRMGASFYQQHVSPLDDEDAWSLLNKQLPPSPSQVDRTGHLKDVGMKIVQKCDGLPLAIKVIGGLLRMRSRTKGEWQAVLNHQAWSVAGLPIELDSRIYLSYEDLSPQLKQCFLYCSLFPKGTLIRRRELIPMWISEGLVQHQDGSSSNVDRLEEIATEYYQELIMRNLIEPTEGNYISIYECRMHDVVRSFAQFIAREESLVVQDQHGAGSSKGSLVHHMSVGPTKLMLEWTDLQKQEMLRTLIIKSKVNFKPGDSFTRFSRLRVLSINGGDCDMLVGSLCQLRHLRYLCLENTNISRLPDDICTLKFLQHIVVEGCDSLENLPGTFIKLGQLRTLHMKRSNVNVIPKGFGELTNLRTLSGFPVHMQMDGDVNWCSLEEIGPLSQIRTLSLHNLEKVAASSFAEMATVSSKNHLDYLGLYWSSSGFMGLRDEINKKQQQQAVEDVIEKLRPPSSIRHLYIEGYFGSRLPNWMLPATWVFKSLRILRMEKLCCCTQLPNGLCQLPSLEMLDINDAPAIKSVGPEFQSPSSLPVDGGDITARSVVLAFPNLTTLRLASFCEWEEWNWEEVSETTEAMAMPVLKELIIGSCKLRCLPPGLASNWRHALRELWLHKLSNLTSLENFPSVVELHVFDCPKLKRISKLSNLQKINILYCPNVEVLEGVPSLDSMEMEDGTMETVPKYVTTVRSRYLKLTCSKRLYESLLIGSSSSEYNKISHIKSRTINYFRR